MVDPGSASSPTATPKAKKSPNRLIVDEAPYDESSVATFNPATMESFGIFRGDTITVRGKMRRDTVLICLSSEQAAEGHIQINRVVRNNLCVKIGDFVSVRPCLDIKYGRRVHILPFEDSIEGLSENIFDVYLKPYFLEAYRPLRKGNKFLVRRDGVERTVEFKVMETDPADYCIVAGDTVIHTEGDALKRDEEPRLLTVGYDDVGGYRKQLARIRELVELPLRCPELFKSIGIGPFRGLIMHGPPGTGKTLIAHAVANETGALLLRVNGPELMSKWAGDSERNLREVFKAAEQNEPAIIFFDEIDSLAPRREIMGGGIEYRVVSQLLTSIDDLKPSSKVVVVGATSKLSSVDPALRRFGRFDHEVEIGVPGYVDRLELLLLHSKNMKLQEDVDLEKIVYDTHGYVGSDIASLCAEAALEQIREKMDLIDPYDNTVDPDILASLEVTMDNFCSALKHVGPSVPPGAVVQTPLVSWGDIGGLDEVKLELQATVEYPMEHPDIFAMCGMSPVNGVLLYGPPGTGKTLLAKAIANECGANFISVESPQLFTMQEPEIEIGSTFRRACATPPCIIFFDDLDYITSAYRSPSGGTSACNRILNQIFIEIDSVSRKNVPVYVIGATNRPDRIDPALLRPGRLDQLIYVPLPDGPSRVSILQTVLKGSPVSDDVDLGSLAKRTSGFSGADLKEICQQACKLAIREEIQRIRAIRGKGTEKLGHLSTPAPLITRKHFDQVMKSATPSIPDLGITQYERFGRNLGKWRDSGNNLRPSIKGSTTSVSITPANNAGYRGVDDDLYG